MAVRFRVKRLVAYGLLFLVIGSASSAAAQDDANRSAARAAGYEGVRAYEQGEYGDAVDKLSRAFDVVKVPTLGLWYARALVKTGKLVEASERYGEVTRLEAKTGKVAEQKQAQAAAAEELAKLQPRIPTLTVVVRGATDALVVTVDGNTVPTGLLGLARPINPGSHEVKAVRGDRERKQSISLAEAERKSVELDLGSEEGGAQVPARSPATDVDRPGPVAAGVDMAQPSDTARTQRTIGWVVLGVGGVATVVGVVTGLMAGSKKSQLDSSGQCDGRLCLPTQNDLRNSYNSLRTVSTIGFIAGGVGLGAGITLLLTTPKNKEKKQANAWLGMGALGVEGCF